MEVKTEPSDQFIERKYFEIYEKYGKLQQDYTELEKEMAKVRKENVELKKEMAKNNEKYKQQIATLNEELAKLKGQNQGEDLESRQSQNSMMDNSQNSIFDDGLPIAEETEQNLEFTAETMIMDSQMDHQQNSQNLVSAFDSAENVAPIIKRDYENGEKGTSFQYQIPTTPSASNNEEEDEEGDELNGLHDFEVDDANFAHTNDDFECDRSISVEMDLDQEINGTRMEENDIDGQIKCAPIKIGEMFKCNWPECEYKTRRSRDVLRNHWRVHTGERPFVCTECGQSFARSDTLRTHEVIHKKEKPHRCNVCGKSFNQSYHLVAHKRIHTGERPYLCKECGQSFNHMAAFKRHVQIHSGAQQCDVCGQTFSNLRKLKRHKLIHEGEQSYQCLANDKQTHTNKRLNLDNNIDSLENTTNIIVKREHENDEMGTNSSFQFQIPATSSTTLNLHNRNGVQQNGLMAKIEFDEQSGRSITIEKDFDENGENGVRKESDIDGQIKCAPIQIGNILKCNWPGCEYQMKTLGDMLIHWRVHTEEGPTYVCEQCGKSFGRSDALKHHKLTHAYERPYICEECGQPFRGLSKYPPFAINHMPFSHYGKMAFK